ncbi:MAG: acetylglutamate kinase [Bacteroidales bacterium]|jgi:acetylglutamate kinase|nr:acetylglutamate kinase [Bacteroidales bacterium]
MKEIVTVLKTGGNVIDHPEVLDAVLQDFALWTTKRIFVHGGGKIADRLMKQLGMEPKMTGGRRITDRQTLDIVTMVYAGLINKNIVAKLQQHGCNAIGLSGADADVIPAVRRPVGEVDYGFVGDVNAQNIRTEQLGKMLDTGLTPVMAPITHDGQGTLLNTNADTIASSVAIALSQRYEVHLVFCFEKNGVLRNPSDDNSVIDVLDETHFRQYKNKGIITAGMIPKLENAFDALHSGVAEIRICSPEGIKNGGTKILKFPE